MAMDTTASTPSIASVTLEVADLEAAHRFCTAFGVDTQPTNSASARSSRRRWAEANRGAEAAGLHARPAFLGLRRAQWPKLALRARSQMRRKLFRRSMPPQGPRKSGPFLPGPA